MRRTIWIILLVILLVFALNQNAIEPEMFTGTWYSTENGNVYCFQNGIIEQIQPVKTPNIDGAYCFARNKIALYVSDLDGIDTVQTLYLASRNGTDILSMDPKGQEKAYFSRNNENI